MALAPSPHLHRLLGACLHEMGDLEAAKGEYQAVLDSGSPDTEDYRVAEASITGLFS